MTPPPQIDTPTTMERNGYYTELAAAPPTAPLSAISDAAITTASSKPNIHHASSYHHHHHHQPLHGSVGTAGHYHHQPLFDHLSTHHQYYSHHAAVQGAVQPIQSNGPPEPTPTYVDISKMAPISTQPTVPAPTGTNYPGYPVAREEPSSTRRKSISGATASGTSPQAISPSAPSANHETASNNNTSFMTTNPATKLHELSAPDSYTGSSGGALHSSNYYTNLESLHYPSPNKPLNPTHATHHQQGLSHPLIPLLTQSYNSSKPVGQVYAEPTSKTTHHSAANEMRHSNQVYLGLKSQPTGLSPTQPVATRATGSSNPLSVSMQPKNDSQYQSQVSSPIAYEPQSPQQAQHFQAIPTNLSTTSKNNNTPISSNTYKVTSDANYTKAQNQSIHYQRLQAPPPSQQQSQSQSQHLHHHQSAMALQQTLYHQHHQQQPQQPLQQPPQYQNYPSASLYNHPTPSSTSVPDYPSCQQTLHHLERRSENPLHLNSYDYPPQIHLQQQQQPQQPMPKGTATHHHTKSARSHLAASSLHHDPNAGVEVNLSSTRNHYNYLPSYYPTTNPNLETTSHHSSNSGVHKYHQVYKGPKRSESGHPTSMTHQDDTLHSASQSYPNYGPQHPYMSNMYVDPSSQGQISRTRREVAPPTYPNSYQHTNQSLPSAAEHSYLPNGNEFIEEDARNVHPNSSTVYNHRPLFLNNFFTTQTNQPQTANLQPTVHQTHHQTHYPTKSSLVIFAPLSTNSQQNPYSPTQPQTQHSNNQPSQTAPPPPETLHHPRKTSVHNFHQANPEYSRYHQTVSTSSTNKYHHHIRGVNASAYPSQSQSDAQHMLYATSRNPYAKPMHYTDGNRIPYGYAPSTKPYPPTAAHNPIKMAGVDIEEHLNSSKISKALKYEDSYERTTASFDPNRYIPNHAYNTYHQDFSMAPKPHPHNQKDMLGMGVDYYSVPTSARSQQPSIRDFLSSWNDDEDEDAAAAAEKLQPQVIAAPPKLIVSLQPMDKSLVNNQSIHVANPRELCNVQNGPLPDILVDIEKPKDEELNEAVGGCLTAATDERLYVLESIPVSLADLSKYKHLNVINRLPDNVVNDFSKDAAADAGMVQPVNGVEASLRIIEDVATSRAKRLSDIEQNVLYDEDLVTKKLDEIEENKVCATTETDKFIDIPQIKKSEFVSESTPNPQEEIIPPLAHTLNTTPVHHIPTIVPNPAVSNDHKSQHHHHRKGKKSPKSSRRRSSESSSYALSPDRPSDYQCDQVSYKCFSESSVDADNEGSPTETKQVSKLKIKIVRQRAINQADPPIERVDQPHIVTADHPGQQVMSLQRLCVDTINTDPFRSYLTSLKAAEDCRSNSAKPPTVLGGESLERSLERFVAEDYFATDAIKHLSEVTQDCDPFPMGSDDEYDEPDDMMRSLVERHFSENEKAPTPEPEPIERAVVTHQGWTEPTAMASCAKVVSDFSMQKIMTDSESFLDLSFSHNRIELEEDEMVPINSSDVSDLSVPKEFVETNLSVPIDLVETNLTQNVCYLKTDDSIIISDVTCEVTDLSISATEPIKKSSTEFTEILLSTHELPTVQAVDPINYSLPANRSEILDNIPSPSGSLVDSELSDIGLASIDEPFGCPELKEEMEDSAISEFASPIYDDMIEEDFGKSGDKLNTFETNDKGKILTVCQPNSIVFIEEPVAKTNATETDLTPVDKIPATIVVVPTLRFDECDTVDISPNTNDKQEVNMSEEDKVEAVILENTDRYSDQNDSSDNSSESSSGDDSSDDSSEESEDQNEVPHIIEPTFPINSEKSTDAEIAKKSNESEVNKINSASNIRENSSDAITAPSVINTPKEADLTTEDASVTPNDGSEIITEPSSIESQCYTMTPQPSQGNSFSDDDNESIDSPYHSGERAELRSLSSCTPESNDHFSSDDEEAKESLFEKCSRSQVFGSKLSISDSSSDSSDDENVRDEIAYYDGKMSEIKRPEMSETLIHEEENRERLSAIRESTSIENHSIEQIQPNLDSDVKLDTSEHLETSSNSDDEDIRLDKSDIVESKNIFNPSSPPHNIGNTHQVIGPSFGEEFNSDSDSDTNDEDDSDLKVRTTEVQLQPLDDRCSIADSRYDPSNCSANKDDGSSGEASADFQSSNADNSKLLTNSPIQDSDIKDLPIERTDATQIMTLIVKQFPDESTSTTNIVDDLTSTSVENSIRNSPLKNLSNEDIAHKILDSVPISEEKYNNDLSPFTRTSNSSYGSPSYQQDNVRSKESDIGTNFAELRNQERPVSPKQSEFNLEVANPTNQEYIEKSYPDDSHVKIYKHSLKYSRAHSEDSCPPLPDDEPKETLLPDHCTARLFAKPADLGIESEHFETSVYDIKGPRLPDELDINVQGSNYFMSEDVSLEELDLEAELNTRDFEKESKIPDSSIGDMEQQTIHSDCQADSEDLSADLENLEKSPIPLQLTGEDQHPSTKTIETFDQITAETARSEQPSIHSGVYSAFLPAPEIDLFPLGCRRNHDDFQSKIYETESIELVKSPDTKQDTDDEDDSTSINYEDMLESAFNEALCQNQAQLGEDKNKVEENQENVNQEVKTIQDDTVNQEPAENNDHFECDKDKPELNVTTTLPAEIYDEEEIIDITKQFNYVEEVEITNETTEPPCSLENNTLDTCSGNNVDELVKSRDDHIEDSPLVVHSQTESYGKRTDSPSSLSDSSCRYRQNRKSNSPNKYNKSRRFSDTSSKYRQNRQNRDSDSSSVYQKSRSPNQIQNSRRSSLSGSDSDASSSSSSTSSSSSSSSSSTSSSVFSTRHLSPLKESSPVASTSVPIEKPAIHRESIFDLDSEVHPIESHLSIFDTVDFCNNFEIDSRCDLYRNADNPAVNSKNKQKRKVDVCNNFDEDSLFDYEACVKKIRLDVDQLMEVTILGWRTHLKKAISLDVVQPIRESSGSEERTNPVVVKPIIDINELVVRVGTPVEPKQEPVDAIHSEVAHLLGESEASYEDQPVSLVEVSVTQTTDSLIDDLTKGDVEANEILEIRTTDIFEVISLRQLCEEEVLRQLRIVPRLSELCASVIHQYCVVIEEEEQEEEDEEEEADKDRVQPVEGIQEVIQEEADIEFSMGLYDENNQFLTYENEVPFETFSSETEVNREHYLPIIESDPNLVVFDDEHMTNIQYEVEIPMEGSSYQLKAMRKALYAKYGRVPRRLSTLVQRKYSLMRQRPLRKKSTVKKSKTKRVNNKPKLAKHKDTVVRVPDKKSAPKKPVVIPTPIPLESKRKAAPRTINRTMSCDAPRSYSFSSSSSSRPSPKPRITRSTALIKRPANNSPPTTFDRARFEPLRKKPKPNFDEILLGINQFYVKPAAQNHQNHNNSSSNINNNIANVRNANSSAALSASSSTPKANASATTFSKDKVKRLIIPRSKIFDGEISARHQPIANAATVQKLVGDARKPVVRLVRSPLIDRLCKLSSIAGVGAGGTGSSTKGGSSNSGNNGESAPPPKPSRRMQRAKSMYIC